MLVHDDLLATGGTARALAELVEGTGAQIVGCAFLVELAFLGGRERLAGFDVHALLSYDASDRHAVAHGGGAARARCGGCVGGSAPTLPRWWPRIERVEGVTDDGWTTVLRSPRGRAVRADWRLEEQRAADLARVGAGARRHAVREGAAASGGSRRGSSRPADGTRVTLEPAPARRAGWARFGRFMLRRAARRELDEALDGLEQALR